MLRLLAVLALAGAGIVAVRGYLRRYDALGRRRPLPWISVCLLVGIAIVLALPSFLRHREEARLDKAASVLVGAPVTVHCETLANTFTDTSGDLGFVKYGADGVPEHHATIARAQCAYLKNYYDGDQLHPSLDEVVAVHVLTHESMHMRGQPVEALAECEAMQRDAETAQLLGATPQESVALAREYWIEYYPNMPASYRSSDCAPGGSLDEHLPDPPWTTGSYIGVKLPS
ncbi:MAG TPA: hypothetical protein VHB69_04340 [Mycobacteriales bacterium]|nr:hypothetical protein [Mycobacteriales bacterium]